MATQFKLGDKVLIPATILGDGQFEIRLSRGPVTLNMGAPADAIPDTRHLPNEVTEAMVEAGARAYEVGRFSNTTIKIDVDHIYLAMERERIRIASPKLKVGDRVRSRTGDATGTLEAIHGIDGWISLNDSRRHCTRALSDLTRMEG